MSKPIIYLDGKFIQVRGGLLESLTPGIVPGRGAFETMRVVDGRVFDFDLHHARLVRGLRLLGLSFGLSKSKSFNLIKRTLAQNKLTNARLRLSVWKNKGQKHICIVAQKVRFGAAYGYKALVVDTRRNRTRYSHVKSIQHHIFYKAFQQARARGFDEAILLNKDKHLVEGSRTNIFFVQKGILYTPSVHCGCLNGIVRQRVIDIARRKGVAVRTTQAGLKRIFACDEAFLTNSIIGVMPLISLNGRKLGSGKKGPLTQALGDFYRQLTLNHLPLK